MKTQKDFYIEDVQTIALKAFQVIEDGLKEYGIVLTPKQDDAIYLHIEEEIEKHSNGNYRHEH